MLSVLIVDDEIATRELLVDYIPWKELGFENVYQAENGEKALQVMDKKHPDLLLSDIAMPKMNGIELLSHIHDDYPNCKAIFLSGYSDKQYLMSAIRLGVIDYIEKPIDLPMLIDLIRTVADRVRYNTKRNEYFTKRGYLIHDLCESDAVTRNEIPMDVLQAYHMSSFSNYVVILTQATSVTHLKAVMDAFKSNISENVASLIYTEWKPGKKPSRAIIGHNFSQEEWNGIIERFKADYQGMDLESFMAIGTIENSLATLPKSYKSAKQRLNYSFYSKTNSVLCETPKYQEAQPISQKFLEELLNALKKRDSVTAHKIIHDLLQKDIIKKMPLPIACIQNNMLLILRAFDSVAADKGLFVLDHADTEEDVSYLWELATWFSSIYQFVNYIDTLIPWICANQPVAPRERSIQKAISFIEDNLGDYRLGVEAVAEYLKLTPSYACQIFKKQTGTTINHFITDLRFKKAKSYLLNSTLSIIEIVAKVGYTDAKYFSKTFKQLEGITPSDYRRNHI